MQKLSRGDLYSLEKYAEVRPQFRATVMQHKKPRRVPLGESATLYFEDRCTMQYQIQEMLRAERIFEAAGIQEELDAYNPLIPDGRNWKVTLMIEFAEENLRRQRLSELVGIEDCVWVKVAGFDEIFAIADEDMERATDAKNSAVHFLRIELGPDPAHAVKSGAAISVGIRHPGYQAASDPVDVATRTALAADIE
jgi:hypothetical protein